MKKLIASVFFITGTSVGGGIVLLPAVIGTYGYYAAIALLIFMWCLNIAISFTFLEAMFYLPKGTHLISMSEKLLGKNTKWFTWLITLSFLYTLMCAYIYGLTEILGSFFNFPEWYLSVLSVLIVGGLIYFGIRFLSIFNNTVVILMFTLFFGMIFLLMSKFHTHTLLLTPMKSPLLALPIVFTSFGYVNVVPSLRMYLNDDINKLKWAILVGSLITLIIYIIWTSIVMGIIPGLGDHSLTTILNEKEPILEFKHYLISSSNHKSLTWMIESFVICALMTSFIGIALALYDFLFDGLQIKKTPIGKLKIVSITFLPPLLIALFQSNFFLKALGFAGLIATILFGIYPVLFTWYGRYIHRLHSQYIVPFNKAIFSLIICACLLIIGVEIWVLMDSAR